jgi:hypothetical protein
MRFRKARHVLDHPEKRRVYESKSSARRRRKFQELERKSIIAVVGVMVFVALVATIALYFGTNIHEH